MLKLIILFTVIPLFELATLIKISDFFGMVYAISLVAVTGILGAAMAKRQGMNVVKRIKDSLNNGMMPADSLIDGMLVLMGGVMLITPGLLTDLGGFACIIPFTRGKIKVLAQDRFNKIISSGKFQFSTDDNSETRTVDIVKDEDEKI